MTATAYKKRKVKNAIDFVGHLVHFVFEVLVMLFTGVVCYYHCFRVFSSKADFFCSHYKFHPDHSVPFELRHLSSYLKSDSKHVLMTYLVVGIGRWDSALTESIGLVIEVSSISVPLILIAMSESLRAELWILLCPLIDIGKEMAKPFNGNKLERIVL